MKAALEDLQENEKSASAASNTEFVSTKRKLTEAELKLEEKERQLKQKQAHIDELNIHLTRSNDKVMDLTEQLARKDEEIRVMEGKYRKYLEKAKQVSVLLKSV